LKEAHEIYLWQFPRLSLVGKTIAAVNRAVVSGLEWDPAVLAARGANSVKEFTLTSAASAFAHIAAGLAPLRLICETSFLEKILFTCRENKFLPAILTNNCFVLMNQNTYLFHFFNTIIKHCTKLYLLWLEMSS